MGFSRKSRYSLYRPGPNRSYFFSRFIRFLFFSFLLYELITGLIFFSIRTQGSSMLPLIQENDNIIILRLSYGQNHFNKLVKIPGTGNPQRGDIVAYRPSYERDYPWVLKPLNSIINFFSLQKKSLETKNSNSSSLLLKRIAGLPGDTVKIKNNVVQVKTASGERFLTEFELTENSYNINISSLPENWNSATNPFNTDSEEIIIDEGYYFLIGDNREIFPDSRNSGLVPVDSIKGKAVLRYWPFKRIHVF